MRRSYVLAAGLLVVPAVALGGFRASSFKKETKLGANYWNAASALDTKMETCWQVDPEAENAGQWFEVDLPRGTVDKLSLVIGWDQDEKTFKDYARVKTARVEVFGSAEDEEAVVHEQTVTFEDKRGWQTVDLNDTAVGGELHGGRVRVTVTETYAGVDYPNLAVSEVLVRMTEQDVAKESIKLKTPPDSIQEGHAAEMITDGNAKTFWAAEKAGEHSFEIRADGFGVSSIGILPGPTSHGRPKTVEVTANAVTIKHTLADKAEVQWFDLPSVVGYTGSAWGTVTVKVIDTYAGKSDPGPAIAEVALRYTNYEGL